MTSIEYVGVAQLDRASGYGPEGREFESSRPRLRDLYDTDPFFVQIGKFSELPIVQKTAPQRIALRRTRQMSLTLHAAGEDTCKQASLCVIAIAKITALL